MVRESVGLHALHRAAALVVLEERMAPPRDIPLSWHTDRWIEQGWPPRAAYSNSAEPTSRQRSG